MLVRMLSVLNQAGVFRPNLKRISYALNLSPQHLFEHFPILSYSSSCHILSPGDAAAAPAAVEDAPAPAAAAAVASAPDKVDMSVVAKPPAPVTPPCKREKASFSDSTTEKNAHQMYKSRQHGNFCWDCKLVHKDIEYFRSRPCIPTEFKATPPDAEEVKTPRKGDAEMVRSQIEEAEKAKAEEAKKLALLGELEAEEIRLNKLLAKKRAREEPKVESTLAANLFKTLCNFDRDKRKTIGHIMHACMSAGLWVISICVVVTCQQLRY